MGKVDDLTKQYIRQNDRFADVCNFYLFNGEPVIKADELVEQDVTELGIFIGDGKNSTTQKIRDVLKKLVLKRNGEAMYMIVGIENQSEIHYAMVVKNMVYDALNYAAQLEKIGYNHKKTKDIKGAEFLSGFAMTDKLIPVITITIYWNTGSWTGPRSLHEMFKIKDSSILKYVQDYKLNLVVPDEIENFEQFATELRIVMEFIQCSDDKESLRKFYSETNKENYISVEAANLLNECFDAKINLEQQEGVCVNMCKGIEDLIAEGVNEGKISGFISASREFGMKDAEIISLIMERFSLTKEEAVNKVAND